MPDDDFTAVPPPVAELSEIRWRDGIAVPGSRAVPEETAVALTYGGSTYAVMMASPQDLEDFGIGFTMTEGIVDDVGEIESVEVLGTPAGVEVRMRLREDRESRLAARRRALAGPVGCGLCGIESLEAAGRAPRPVGGYGRPVAASAILAAMGRLAPLQALNMATRAVHAAAFCDAAGALTVREDVGRHNALDKLAGALVRAGLDAAGGMVLLTSRLSVEMIQKSAAIGARIVAAVSAPTALAVRTAEEAGITLVGIARSDGFEIFTHPERVSLAPPAAAREA